MNYKLYSHHLDPVWRGNVKFKSFLFGETCFGCSPQPLLPCTVKCWDFGSQKEVGFLVEFFLTFLMNVNLYYLTDYSWCKILSCIKIKKIPNTQRLACLHNDCTYSADFFFFNPVFWIFFPLTKVICTYHRSVF